MARAVDLAAALFAANYLLLGSPDTYMYDETLRTRKPDYGNISSIRISSRILFAFVLAFLLRMAHVGTRSVIYQDLLARALCSALRWLPCFL